MKQRGFVEDLTIVSCFGLGLLPYAPGTWGSFGSILAGAFLVWLGMAFDMIEAITLVLVLSTAALFWLGITASERFCNAIGKHDDARIVIDEWVGQWVALLIFLGGMALGGNVHGSFTPEAWAANHSIEPLLVGSLMMLGLFLFFRLYDVMKPGWAGWADEHLDGGYGVMMDDVFAGLFAGLSALGVAWLVSLII